VTAETVQVLGISGSLRGASTNSAAIRTAQAVAPDGVEVVVYDAMAQLPHFNPDHDADPLDTAVAELRAAVGRADAVLLSTPEYAGALPGSFKNLLDWTVGGIEMNHEPVGWINVSASGTGAADAHASLAKVLGYVDADVVADACVHLPVAHGGVGADGLVDDGAFRTGAAQALATLAAHVRALRSAAR
jgi:NAD(P)H-dependent FMN reductase